MIKEKEHNSEKSDFMKVAGYVSTILAFIAAGFAAGQYFESSKLDNNKSILERNNTVLSDSIERLKATIRNDSISRKNFILQNTHHLYFNTDSGEPHTLLVANGTVAPCQKGSPDGCWKDEISIKVGDFVGIQIYFHNTGDDSVSNVSLGYRLEYSNSAKTIICRGGIVVGNIVVSSGVAHMFSNTPVKLRYLPEKTNFFRTGESKGELIKAGISNGYPNFQIGSIPAGNNSQGILILGFIVEKLN